MIPMLFRGQVTIDMRPTFSAEQTIASLARKGEKFSSLSFSFLSGALKLHIKANENLLSNMIVIYNVQHSRDPLSVNFWWGFVWVLRLFFFFLFCTLVISLAGSLIVNQFSSVPFSSVQLTAGPFQSNALSARFWLLLKTKLDAKATATMATTTATVKDKRKNCNANLIRF